MKTKVQKWGNSLAIRIPAAFTATLDLSPSSSVKLSIEKGRLIISPLEPLHFELNDLLAGITDENLHGEADMGGTIESAP